MSDLLTPAAAASLRLSLGTEFDSFLARLPRLMDDFAWSTGMRLGRPHPGATSSAMFECTTQSGERALVRIGADPGMVARETMGLWAWGLHGLSPSALSSNIQAGTVSFQRVPSGVSLADELVSADEGERVASLLRALHGVSIPQQASIPRAEDVLLNKLEGALGVVDHLPDVPVTALDLRRSVTILEDLTVSKHESVLLHGDLSPERIMVQDDRLVVVSPRTMVGDPALDVATFAARKDPKNALVVGHFLSSLLGLDPRRVHHWLRVVGPEMALHGRLYGRCTPTQWGHLAALGH